MLKEGKAVSLVADDCGFGSASQFSRCFKARHELSPKQFQLQYQKFRAEFRRKSD